MHSSPSLRPRFAAALTVGAALASFGCQDASAPAKEVTAAEPHNAETPPTAASETQSPAEASPMTRVGSPRMTPSGSSGTQAPASEEDASAPSTPERKQAEPSMPTVPAAPDLSCSANGDCKMFESSCGSCRCLILPADAEPPVCTGPKVTCVISPCRDKKPICNAQMCALKDEGPATM